VFRWRTDTGLKLIHPPIACRWEERGGGSAPGQRLLGPGGAVGVGWASSSPFGTWLPAINRLLYRVSKSNPVAYLTPAGLRAFPRLAASYNPSRRATAFGRAKRPAERRARWYGVLGPRCFPGLSKFPLTFVLARHPNCH
jgi:hypothetical protein